MAVEAVDVVPAGVEDSAVVGHRRRPLEVLERRDRPQVPAVGVHDVQREHGHGAVVVAAAANVAVGQIGLGRRLPVGLARTGATAPLRVERNTMSPSGR